MKMGKLLAVCTWAESVADFHYFDKKVSFRYGSKIIQVVRVKSGFFRRVEVSNWRNTSWQNLPTREVDLMITLSWYYWDTRSSKMSVIHLSLSANKRKWHHLVCNAGKLMDHKGQNVSCLSIEDWFDCNYNTIKTWQHASNIPKSIYTSCLWTTGLIGGYIGIRMLLMLLNYFYMFKTGPNPVSKSVHSCGFIVTV